MKFIFSFLKTTITGGVLFLLPITLLIIIFSKALNILHKVSAPISEKMPEIIFGFDGSKLIAIFLLILLCFLSEPLFRARMVKGWIQKIEDNIHVNVPGYVLIKSIAAGAVGEQSDTDMIPVLMHEEESWSKAFLIEKRGKYSTEFIPEAPSHDSGEVKIIPTSRIEKLDVSAHKFTQIIKTFGKGAKQWVK